MTPLVVAILLLLILLPSGIAVSTHGVIIILFQASSKTEAAQIIAPGMDKNTMIRT